LGIDVLTDTDGAVTEDSSEGSGQGIFLESFACEQKGGLGPHIVGTGLIVFLLGNGAIAEKRIGTFESFFGVKEVGFCFGDTGRLFGFVDLEKHVSFFDYGAFGHGDGSDFTIDFGFDVDGFFRLKGADGGEGFEKGPLLDGHEFDGNRSIFRGSTPFLACDEPEKHKKKNKMIHMMNG
jgi:hypothetical protein